MAALSGPGRMRLLLPLTGLLLQPCLAEAASTLVILPNRITLTGPEARQQLIVEKVRDQQYVGQLTNAVDCVSSDPAVVRIDQGAAVPVKNGAATISVKAGTSSASVPVMVSGMEKPFDWSFR